MSTAARQRQIAVAELVAVAFIGFIAAAANKTGVSLLLFPELAALSHDVLTRPRGKWASQPIRLVMTPTLCAVAGLLVTRHTHYGMIPMLVIVVASTAIIWLLRSSIAPAISAGVLPMVLDERHWMYPLAIFVGLVFLAFMIWVRAKRDIAIDSRSDATLLESIDEELEISSHDRFWFIHLLAFVLILTLTAQLTGLRFILFPPLIVMAYEVFGHPEIPGWMERPMLFPFICFLTALAGLFSRSYVSNTAVAAAIAVAVSIVLLRVFQVHMPPALAVGLLPFVMKAPNIWYPISVGIGTGVLTLWFVTREYTRQLIEPEITGNGVA